MSNSLNMFNDILNHKEVIFDDDKCQDINIYFKSETESKLITIRELINDVKVNESKNKLFDVEVYHIATFWADTDSEFRIAYSPTSDIMLAYAMDTRQIISSRCDLFDLALQINSGYSNKQIINIIFKSFADRIMNIDRIIKRE